MFSVHNFDDEVVAALSHNSATTCQCGPIANHQADAEPSFHQTVTGV